MTGVDSIPRSVIAATIDFPEMFHRQCFRGPYNDHHLTETSGELFLFV
jgi:hypothetical protein